MDQLISSAAISGATFIGRAAWSYAASIALKKITSKISGQQAKDTAEIGKLQVKLERKLAIITPIIDSLEMMSAQGQMGLESLLLATDSLKSDLNSLSLEQAPKESDLTELLETIDDLIPLLGLVMQRCKPDSSSKYSYSRLLKASSQLVTGDALIAYTTVKDDYLKLSDAFPVRLYSLFEGSARKSGNDFTWKEECVKAVATIERSLTERRYRLKIVQDLNDERHHDELDGVDSVAGKFIAGASRIISIVEISKMFYTSSGSLLAIEDSTLPVLVLKISKEANQSESGSSTPKLGSKNEWIALELFRKVVVDDDSESEEDDIVKTLKDLKVDPEKSHTVKAEVDSPLDTLCLLEYLIRLCALETREKVSHTAVGDAVFDQYFINTANSNEEKIAGVQIAHTINSPMRNTSLTAQPTPTKRGPKSLLDRFLG